MVTVSTQTQHINEAREFFCGGSFQKPFDFEPCERFFRCIVNSVLDLAYEHLSKGLNVARMRFLDHLPQRRYDLLRKMVVEQDSCTLAHVRDGVLNGLERRLRFVLQRKK